MFQNLLISVNTVKTISLSDHHYPGKKAYKQKFINLVYLHDVLSSGNKSGSMCCQQDSVPRPVALDALELQQLLYWLLVKKMSLNPYLYVAKEQKQVLHNALTKLLAVQPQMKLI